MIGSHTRKTEVSLNNVTDRVSFTDHTHSAMKKYIASRAILSPMLNPTQHFTMVKHELCEFSYFHPIRLSQELEIWITSLNHLST